MTKSKGINRRFSPNRGVRHGLTDTPEFHIWDAMLQRCTNKKTIGYRLYGGRGILVCDRWMTFLNFLADMGPRPSSGHSIDRIDSDGNYEPSNCRWATAIEQANNTRRNRRLLVDGRNLTISQWSRESGIKRSTIMNRLRAGWDAKDAVTIPAGSAPKPQPKGETMVPCNCEACGKPFVARLAERNRGRGRFCCQRCGAAGWRKAAQAADRKVTA